MKKVWDKWTRIALVKRILVGLILGAILGIAVPQATGIAILGGGGAPWRRTGKRLI